MSTGKETHISLTLKLLSGLLVDRELGCYFGNTLGQSPLLRLCVCVR
jgi:hypothetical protein